MTAAPLPPHERSWRHPSELAPTAASVEPSPVRSRVVAFSSGAVAAVLVAVMVVSITPRRSSAPSAVSATTTPPASAQIEPRAAAPIGVVATNDDMVLLGNRSLASGRPSAALVGAPNAISSAPLADPAGLVVAGTVPTAQDRVLVLTSSFTYDVAWGAIDDLHAPSGSVVITYDGELLASFGDDGLRLLID